MNFLQRIFSRESDVIEDQSHSTPEETCPTVPNSLPPGLTVAKISDIGLVRERNEDAYLAVDITLHSDDELALSLIHI